MKHQCPELVKAILHDLLNIEGYTEVDIAFASGVSIELVRKIRFGKDISIAQNEFLALLDFFSRLFHRKTRFQRRHQGGRILKCNGESR